MYSKPSSPTMKNPRAEAALLLLSRNSIFPSAIRQKILGTIYTNDISAETTIQQGKIWKNEIQVLKEQPRKLGEGRIVFEYTIPGMGKRVDTPASERDSARPLR